MKYGKYNNIYIRKNRLESKLKEHKKLEKDYYFRAHNQERDCFYSDCESPTINSHIVSQSKHLDFLSEGKNKKVFELYYSPFDNICKFKPTFVRNALQFQGFCDHHDFEVFKSIESESVIDHSLYKNQLKHFYRALLYEARKKEVRIGINVQLEKDFPNSYYSKQREQIIEKFSNDLVTIYHIKSILEEEFNDKGANKFMTFHYFEIPRIDICASIMYSKTFDGRITNHSFHLLPSEKTTHVVFGYSNQINAELCEKYYQEFYKLDSQKLLKKISDILILYSESFVISPQFHKSLGSKTKKIPMLIQKHLRNKPETIDFNIF